MTIRKSMSSLDLIFSVQLSVKQLVAKFPPNESEENKESKFKLIYSSRDNALIQCIDTFQHKNSKKPNCDFRVDCPSFLDIIKFTKVMHAEFD